MKTLTLTLLLFSLNSFGKDLAPFNLPIYKSNKAYSYKAGKKTVINFWATWCTSCIQEIPVLEKLKKDHPNVEFLAINAGDSPRKIKKFLKKHGFTYTVLMDKSKDFSKGLGVLSLPQTFVINELGTIIYHKDVPPTKL